jgi:hypothetical protein
MNVTFEAGNTIAVVPGAIIDTITSVVGQYSTTSLDYPMSVATPDGFRSLRRLMAKLPKTLPGVHEMQWVAYLQSFKFLGFVRPHHHSEQSRG